MTLTGIGPTNGGLAVLRPPTVAPVLIATTMLGSTTANLAWTASNKISSPGFGYKVFGGIAPSFTQLGTTTGLSYDADYPAAAGETYSFYVVPYNDAGEGPSSNTVSAVLPGEFDGRSYYLRPDGISLYLRPDGLSKYLRPS